MKLFPLASLAAIALLSSSLAAPSFSAVKPEAQSAPAAVAEAPAKNKKQKFEKYSVEYFKAMTPKERAKEKTRIEKAINNFKAEYLKFLPAQMTLTQVEFDIKKEHADEEVSQYEKDFTVDEKTQMDKFNAEIVSLKNELDKTIPEKVAKAQAGIAEKEPKIEAAQQKRDDASAELAAKEAEESAFKKAVTVAAAVPALMDRKATPEKEKAQNDLMQANHNLGLCQEKMDAIDVIIDTESKLVSDLTAAKDAFAAEVEKCTQESNDVQSKMSALSAQRMEAARKIIERISAAQTGLSAQQVAAHRAALTGGAKKEAAPAAAKESAEAPHVAAAAGA